MVNQRLKLTAARVERALCAALLAACAVFLNGCNSFPDDAGDPPQNQHAGREVPAAAGGRTELSRAAGQYLAPATPGNAGYKIGPQDVLDFTVFRLPELSKTVQVADAGTINLPLVGEIGASGRTATEVERDIAARLSAKYVKSAQVTVFVKEYNSQRVTVEGAVKNPGVYPIRGHDTLLQSVAKAGGLDKDTASSSVVVFRNAGGGRSAMRFDIGDIRGGRSEDPPIQAGDVIVVDDSLGKAAFQTLVKLLPLASPVMFLF